VRFYSIRLLLLVLVAFPNSTPAQRVAPASGKNAESQRDTKGTPPVVPENWRVLDDLTSGLKVRPPVVLQSDEQTDFVRQLVRVQWRMNDPIDLWIIHPKVTGAVPVVLYLYSYSANSDRFHDNGWCKRATADGFAAVGFVAALTDYRFRYRPLKQWFVSELTESLGSSVHDVQMILNYLAGRGDFDMNRVGMFGMGSGASIAILAAHADSRIKTLDLLDPWGDWPDWLRESPEVTESERSKYLSPEFLKSVAVLEPVTYLPSLKTQRLRLQQTLSEPVTPKTAKERIAAALPDPNELVKYTNAEDLMKAWKTTGLSGWIKQQMRSETPKSSSDDRQATLGGVR
jgi:acetyl esterase/lipase